MDYTVVIPTYNRPKMLAEAITSIAQQQGQGAISVEIVIIDDSSSPPVDIEDLHKLFAGHIQLHRNDSPCGLAYNRDKGVQLASADIVIHLDDDDMLAPDALARITQFFAEHPDHGSTFLGVKGFGKSKKHFEQVQNLGLSKAMARCKFTQTGSTVLFSEPLLPALLKSVPMCFQRIAVKKSLWIATNNLRLKAYQKSTSPEHRDKSMREITGPLRDTEWAIYHSLLTTPALLNTPIYHQRCDGQGMVSVAAMRDKQVYAHIAIKQQLVKASHHMQVLKSFTQQIKRNMADTFFNEAYYQLHTLKDRKKAFTYWVATQKVLGQPAYKKFALSLCIPHTLLPRK